MRTGLLAEFETPEELLRAIEALHAKGYRNMDAFTPYPFHGLEEALRIRRSGINLVVGPIAIFLAIMAYGVQWFCNAYNYPLNVGGRPPHSPLTNVPITFETGVLWASLLGISVSGMIMLTFIYSAILGGLAGILVAPVLFVSIQMGSTIALKAFAATIIGGFGDVAGAIIGGLALGIIETFGAAYVSVPYKDGFAFLVLVAFLVFRPQGIFGERVAEKA